MENTTTPSGYKRTMDAQTRNKISQTMKSKNIKHTSDWNRKIADGVRKAWTRAQPPQNSNGIITYDN